MENNHINIQENEVVNINYTQPKFWHRVMANFIDFFLFALFFFILFISARSIVLTTTPYKQAEQTITEVRLNSGLYKKDVADNDNLVDVIYYINKYCQVYGSEFDGKGEGDEEPTGKNGKAVHAINQFIEYCSDPEITSHERYLELINYYDSMRLDTLTSDGIHFFIKDGEDIIPNEAIASNPEKRKLYYQEVYAPLIEKRFLPFLTSNVTKYRDAYRLEFNFLVFLELPVAYVISAVIVYYVPGLIFKRGRMTLGKAIYRVGLIDSRILSPTLGRFTLRFLILLFAELILSLFSFGIPYIISFSMMAFSKNKQGFPDYMLHLYEVDTSKSNIYMDYVEAELKNELHGEAIDFRMEKPL